MSSTMSGILSALSYAGIGAGLGTVGASIIAARSSRGEQRAHAAEILSNAAGGLADRLSTLNEKLDKDNRELREALFSLIEVIDMLLPYIKEAPPNIITKVEKISKQAKQAL